MLTILSRMPQLKFVLSFACLLIISFCCSSLAEAKTNVSKPQAKERQNWTLSFNHLGPLKIGMTPDEVMREIHQTLKGQTLASDGVSLMDLKHPKDFAKVHCVWSDLQTKGSKSDYQLTFLQGKLAAISFVVTDTGIALGDDIPKIKRLYSSKLYRMTHSDNFWIVLPKEKNLEKFAMKFTDDYSTGRISEIKAGRYDLVKESELIDYCSPVYPFPKIIN
ncbi:MAG: hypothetical protein K2X66_05985 [Cyanobacteria bacterium]|nr:hypothetical protein [Cyanobacteriota bacterium]